MVSWDPNPDFSLGVQCWARALLPTRVAPSGCVGTWWGVFRGHPLSLPEHQTLHGTHLQAGRGARGTLSCISRPAWSLAPPPRPRGVGELKVWASQAELLEKSIIQTRLLDWALSQRPGRSRVGGTFLGGGGGGEAWETRGLAWARQEKACSSPRHGPPRVPGAQQGPPSHPLQPPVPRGQHFPSQPRVPSPGWTPVVWLRPMAVPALRSGKSLAPGHLRPRPPGLPRASLPPDTHRRGRRVLPHLPLAGARRGPTLSRPHTGGRKAARVPPQGSPSLSPALGLESSLLSHPVSGKLPGPNQAG